MPPLAASTPSPTVLRDPEKELSPRAPEGTARSALPRRRGRHRQPLRLPAPSPDPGGSGFPAAPAGAGARHGARGAGSDAAPRRRRGLRPHRALPAARRAGQHHRRQWRWQDHALQRHHRLRAAKRVGGRLRAAARPAELRERGIALFPEIAVRLLPRRTVSARLGMATILSFRRSGISRGRRRYSAAPFPPPPRASCHRG
jgi:hypothetical protein